MKKLIFLFITLLLSTIALPVFAYTPPKADGFVTDTAGNSWFYSLFGFCPRPKVAAVVAIIPVVVVIVAAVVLVVAVVEDSAVDLLAVAALVEDGNDSYNSN